MLISQPDLDYPPVRRPSHLVILTVLSWQLKLTNTHNTFLCLFLLSPGMLDTECQLVRVRRKLLSLASLEFISQLHPGDTVAALPVSTHATLSKLSQCSCYWHLLLQLCLFLSFHCFKMWLVSTLIQECPGFEWLNCFSFSETGVWTRKPMAYPSEFTNKIANNRMTETIMCLINSLL